MSTRVSTRRGSAAAAFRRVIQDRLNDPANRRGCGPLAMDPGRDPVDADAGWGCALVGAAENPAPVGAREIVYVYRYRPATSSEVHWAMVPVLWLGATGSEGTVTALPWERLPVQARDTALDMASVRLRAVVGFEEFLDAAFDRVERANRPDLRAYRLGQVRAILQIVDDPATEPVRLLAALRLG